jgi:hypothetical protein
MWLRATLTALVVVASGCGPAEVAPTTTERVTTTLPASTTSLATTTTTRVKISGGDPFSPLPDGVGPLLIAESDRDQVLLVHPDGFKEVILGGVANPRGLGLSADGLTLAVAVAGREPGGGAVILVTADRQVTTVIDGLDHPEDVSFYGDEILVFTGFADSTINVIATDGSAHRSIEVDGQPTGTAFVERIGLGWGPQVGRGVVFVTWEDGVFHFDPLTDGVTHLGWGRTQGGGHPGYWGPYSFCVPDYLADGVPCFTGDVGGTWDIRQPVAVTSSDYVIIITGVDGVTIGDVLYGPLANPAGVVVLDASARAWLDADLNPP